MTFEIIKGEVDYLDRGADIIYAAAPMRGGSMTPFVRQIASFRVGGRSVTLPTMHFPPLAEGDKVAVLGAYERGGFQAFAIRNLTTGEDFYTSYLRYKMFSWLFILLGIPALFLLGLGLLPIALGVFFLVKIGAAEKAMKGLRNANYTAAS